MIAVMQRCGVSREHASGTWAVREWCESGARVVRGWCCFRVRVLLLPGQCLIFGIRADAGLAAEVAEVAETPPRPESIGWATV